MSKHHKPQQRPQEKAPAVDESDVPLGIEAAIPTETVPEHRRCPLCWNGCKGVGTAYSKQGRSRYYKCTRTLSDQPPCGHTWKATIKVEVMAIEHQKVSVEGLR